MAARRSTGWSEGLTGSLIDGRYQVLKRLGLGGMAAVYQAVDMSLDREVAIKVGRPGAGSIETERFLREARMLASLDHPNIVRVFNMGTLPNGRPYMVMELLRGKTFGELMRSGPAELSRIIDRLWEIASALDWIHKRGIIHRDLKLDNMMLVQRSNGRESAKLLDFGIAIDHNLKAGRLTRGGSIMGTPLYIAPELMETDRLTPRTDLYAFGVVVYQLLTGAPPFEAPSSIELLRMKTTQDAPLMSVHRTDLPSGVDEAVAKTLARRPEDRPACAGDVVRALAVAMARSSRPRRRRQLAVAGSVAFILAALISGYATLNSHRIEARSLAPIAEEVAVAGR